jgi:hypothetical protein
MTWLIVVIAVVVVLAAAAAYKWNRSAALRHRFGPEYERILAQEGGDQRRADAALRDRTRRRAALDVRELDADALTRYRDRWFAVQGHFVDDPRAAVTEAAALVRSVMNDRGYHAEEPALADDPDARVYDELDLAAVDHPEAVSRYRAAQDAEGSSGASTEQLRQGFQGYKALFEALIARGEDTTGADGSGDGPRTLGSTLRHRVVDLRRRRGDRDGHDGDDGRHDGAAAGAGSSTGGFLGRFRPPPADREIR